ncbi:MAG: NAD(P)/FAD-dependent oxidoreductase [Candidatus Eisenbacteria bacterium]|nr:NAD(P)/FAD-dependent oxidoreductase [Candidatus Eisenbacteria bacterium]
MRHQIPDRADALVVGAGTGGAVAARRIAASGLRVLLIERHHARDVGRKVCGNALAGDGVAAVQRRIPPPAGAEVAMRVSGATVVLPDGRSTVELPGEGVILNRLVFGQRLLRDAAEAGVEIADECTCVGWSDREAGRVRVRLVGDREAEVTAKVVIDATGYRGLLTRSGGPSREDTLARDQVGIAYREIAPVTESFGPDARVVIVPSPEGAEGGYGWVFPMGDRLANLGVGAQLSGTARTIRDAFVRFRERPGGPRVLAALEGGLGMLPLRPPLASMVGDRFMTVGDAACQANPLHGGGIAPSIIGGAMAGEVAVRASGRGAASAGALWPYNVAFMKEVGSVHAAHDVLRRFLAGLSPRDFTALAAAVAQAGDAGALAGPSARPASNALRLLGAIGARPGLAVAFARTARLMESVRRVYEGYPDAPAGLDAWRRRVGALMRRVGGMGGG